jgi:hypothetical protein
MIDCIVHDVPFPAYETFEDVKTCHGAFSCTLTSFSKLEDTTRGYGVPPLNVTTGETLSAWEPAFLKRMSVQ